MEDSILSSLEEQLTALYSEKEYLEKELGTSVPEQIYAEFTKLEESLVQLYEFKEFYRKIDSSKISIESLSSVFLSRERFTGI